MFLDESFDLTSGTPVSWDTSYLKKTPLGYVQMQISSNSKNIMISGGVGRELERHFLAEESYKYEIIKKIIDNNGTYNNPAEYSTDNSIVDLADIFKGVVFSGDYGVIARACCRGVKSVYIIDEKELERSNGIGNFIEIYRKNVGKEIKKLK